MGIKPVHSNEGYVVVKLKLHKVSYSDAL